MITFNNKLKYIYIRSFKLHKTNTIKRAVADYDKLVQRKIKKQKILVAVIHKKILDRCVQVILTVQNVPVAHKLVLADHKGNNVSLILKAVWSSNDEIEQIFCVSLEELTKLGSTTRFQSQSGSQLTGQQPATLLASLWRRYLVMRMKFWSSATLKRPNN